MPGWIPAAGTVVGAGLRVLAVAACYAILLGGIEYWKRRAGPPIEWTRKAVHVGGGLAALAFPWIFATHWAVLSLALIIGAALWLARRRGALGSVHEVQRGTEGALFYPLAIYLLFLVGSDRPVFYGIAVLTLVLSDALAALVGSSYGRVMYEVESDRRTVEGSVVFFLVTFLAVHLPLLLLTELDPATGVLIGLQLALLVTFIEGVSLHGADNLIIPIATYFFLARMTAHTAEFILWQIAAQLAILGVLALVAYRYGFLTGSGVLAASLMFYGAWALGGPEWIVAPSVGLALAIMVYLWLTRRRPDPGAPAPDGSYQVRAVFYTSVVPAALYVLNNLAEHVPGVGESLPADPAYPLYVGAVAAQLANLLYDWFAGTGRVPGARGFMLALAPALAGVIPAGLAVQARPATLIDATTAATVCVAGVALYRATYGLPRGRRERLWKFRLQAASVGAVAAIAVAVHAARVM